MITNPFGRQQRQHCERVVITGLFLQIIILSVSVSHWVLSSLSSSLRSCFLSIPLSLSLSVSLSLSLLSF